MEVGEKEKKARSSIVRSKEKECSCISSSSLMRILLRYMIKERHKSSLEADILIRNKEIWSAREVAYNYILVCECKDLSEWPIFAPLWTMYAMIFFISLKSVGETEINENIHYLHKFSTVGSVALYNLKFELAVLILYHWPKFEMNFFCCFQ